ncbi:MAG: RNA polymerase factor sigma-54 [Nitrospirae bacterium]|nr:RNA polymerase factor sigma-54 [Nitrospirota bacterium]MDA8215309.1 RNA polymerase factor sigma-54 [Nitrospiraceae bacterium]
MALESRLDLRLAQKLILTPQLQQAIKLLQMPQLELAQTLNNELVENPFLEEAFEEPETEEYAAEETALPTPADDTEMPFDNLINFGVDEYFDERSSDGRDLGYFSPGIEEQPSYELFCSKKPDLYDHLLWQLRLCSADDEVRRAAEAVIGNIDEDGYLRATEEELSSAVSADIDIIRSAMALVQSFDPSGVGARDLKECLLLQLNALNLRGTLVEKIINNNMEDLQKKKYSNIAKQYNSPMDDIIAAVKIIEGLEPRPATSFSSTETNYIAPDVFINKTDEGYQIILNDDGMPRLRLNNSYRKLLLKKEMLTKEEKEFLKDKLRLATELIKSLDQRNKTIYKVSDSILKFQRDFFDRGVQHLRPLNLRDVASDINMHESTVSRVTSNKFLACNHGVFSFRFFFSSAIQSETGEVSSASVKDSIKKIIAEEDTQKPLSDQMIADRLKMQDINIARRTVAKYREELKIPPQSQRKRYE